MSKKSKKSLNRLFSEEKGQSLVLVAIFLVALLGISAFVVDAGYLFFQKRHLQNTADAAALAGVRELVDGDANSISSVVVDYIEAHGLSSSDITNMPEIQSINSGDTEVPVELQVTRGLFFARVLGFQDSSVAARAMAATGPPANLKGLIPLGIPDEVYQAEHTFNIYTVDNNQIFGPGNWGFVDLDAHPGGGVPELEDYLINGYNDYIDIDDWILTETGNKANSSKIKNAVPLNQIVYVPIIDVSGKQMGVDPVQVKGFAALVLTEIGSTGPGTSGDMYIIGEFVKNIAVGDIYPDGPDYGVKVIALVE